MTVKTASVHARIQPLLKTQVEAVLYKLGISTSEAIAIYFSQIALQKGLPFEVRVPNKTTRKAMKEARSGRSKKFSSVSDLMRDLNA
jgi:DNA-damage-inducible protein J